MSHSIVSLDHRLNELRQVGDELRAARYFEQVRRAGSTTATRSFGESLHDLLTGLRTLGRPSRLATH